MTELRSHLAAFAARCRVARWFGALFHARVAEDIAADVAQHQARVCGQAYGAEQSDLEAAKLLESAARDGLQACDMPAVAQAIRLIRRSATADHNITEALRT